MKDSIMEWENKNFLETNITFSLYNFNFNKSYVFILN